MRELLIENLKHKQLKRLLKRDLIYYDSFNKVKRKGCIEWVEAGVCKIIHEDFRFRIHPINSLIICY